MHASIPVRHLDEAEETVASALRGLAVFVHDPQEPHSRANDLPV